MKEIAVDILLCTVDRQRTLMKGDKVVELLEKCTNLLLLSVSVNCAAVFYIGRFACAAGVNLPFTAGQRIGEPYSKFNVRL